MWRKAYNKPAKIECIGGKLILDALKHFGCWMRMSTGSAVKNVIFHPYHVFPCRPRQSGGRQCRWTAVWRHRKKG